MKKLLQFTIALTILITLGFVPKNKKTVILDVAHGGKDLGVTNNELSEKDIVLRIAKKVQLLNKDGELEIILTREIDHYISLNDRVDLANNQVPALLLSLHANNSPKTDVNGFEIYIKENSLTEESLLIAEVIANEYPSQIRERKITAANFTVLKNSNCPSALLEIGFMSNENDRNYMLSEEGQWEIAEAIYNSIR